MEFKRFLRGLGPAIEVSRRLRLRAAVAVGDVGLVGARESVSTAVWADGISVVIPERSSPDLLARALEHLQPAVATLTEPWEIIVVVNGAPLSLYRHLRRRWPQVRWDHHAAPLGFSTAVARGLDLARFGGVYLHNSDMAVAPDALARLLPWRAPHVFAIASQIFFDDPAKRREETGWGDLALGPGGLELFDRTPEPDGRIRSGLYAGGGASLFDAGQLRRAVAETRGYDPFYWEDVEWGLQAWRWGLEVLFQPQSIAHHRHRATIGRFYTPAEIDAVVARNRLWFAARNLARGADLAREVAQADWHTLKALSQAATLVEISRARRRGRRAPFPDLPAERRTRHVHSRPPARRDRPLILVVSPFQVLPPRHGSAQRLWRLCEALQGRWRFMLLSDEGTGHGPAAWARMGPFESVCLVEGRPDSSADRMARIRAHSHPRLQDELDRLTRVYRPDLVQIEHVELAGLEPPSGIPSVLTAHDVLISGDDPLADAFERDRLARYDGRIVASAEDRDLLAPLSAIVVPNGASLGGRYRPSTGQALLFTGPFRYAPNLIGVRRFLEGVYPALKREFPDLTFTILGGEGARALAATDPLLRLLGVRVVNAVDNVRPWLSRCALTVNPLSGTRGSSVKLIESLAAGRVCVSTRDGARGFHAAELTGLVVTEDVEAMLAPLRRLLSDPSTRVALERPSGDQLQSHSWRSAARPQAELYTRLVPGIVAK